MPVLESPAIAFAETRLAALASARAMLDEHRDSVLAVRIGATDLSAPFALRRSRDMTVYDVRRVADVISDVVNVFTRVDAEAPGQGELRVEVDDEHAPSAAAPGRGQVGDGGRLANSPLLGADGDRAAHGRPFVAEASIPSSSPAGRGV